MRSKKGQNIIEYTLLIVSFIIIFLYFLGPYGPFKRMINGVLDGSIKQFEDGVNKL